MKKIAILLVVVLMFSLVGCGSESSPEITQEEQTKEVVLLDDEVIRVSFIDLFEEESVKGSSYLRLKVENKTEEVITVYSTDCYVNDTQCQSGSGVPMTIETGKQSQNPFIIFAEYDSIEKLELRLMVMDENSVEIETTDLLIIPTEG